ncbi:MAG: hypothetical protein ABJH52_07225 [Henriciella sp.]
MKKQPSSLPNTNEHPLVDSELSAEAIDRITERLRSIHDPNWGEWGYRNLKISFSEDYRYIARYELVTAPGRDTQKLIEVMWSDSEGDRGFHSVDFEGPYAQRLRRPFDKSEDTPTG